MKAITNTSRIVLATALLSVAFTGCGRKAEQTGSTESAAPGSTSSTATAPSAGTTGGGTPGTAGTTAPGGSATGSAATAGGTSGSSESSGSSMGSVIDDSAITVKVKAALLADADIKGTDINVETRQGEVQLNGFVNNQQQVDKAVKVASAVDGVKKVDNKLTVKK